MSNQREDDFTLGMSLLIVAIGLFMLIGRSQTFEPIEQPCTSLIKFDNDRFTGVKSVYAVSTMGAFTIVFRSTKSNDYTRNTLTVARAGETFKYIDCPHVDVLIGGKQTSLNFLYDPDASSGMAYEIFTASLTVTQWRELANAKQVEMRVCNDVYQIPEDVLCAAKEIYRVGIK